MQCVAKHVEFPHVPFVTVVIKIIGLSQVLVVLSLLLFLWLHAELIMAYLLYVTIKQNDIMLS